MRRNTRPKRRKGNKGRHKYHNRGTQAEMSGKYKLLRNVSSEEELPSGSNRKLEVYIYQSEMKKIKNWVLQYRSIETGGDLFGLWVNSHTAVVQFALGPGKNCNRYETAFFQDLEYLANAGSHLTEKHGLCNIGQWHSHHQLSLNKPSSGDESTVWRHMPTLGLTRYIVCIANISKQKYVYNASVNCFLFELNNQKEMPVIEGDFVELKNPSPVNEHAKIAEVIAQGAEPAVERDDDETEMSCWFDFKCMMRGFASKLWKCFRSEPVKYLAILGIIATPFVVLLIVFMPKTKETHY